MKKIITIKGMSCSHCKSRVEKALEQLDGVSAKVNLSKGQAVVSLNKEVADAVLSSAITEAGYTVLSVTEKKGLFKK